MIYLKSDMDDLHYSKNSNLLLPQPTIKPYFLKPIHVFNAHHKSITEFYKQSRSNQTPNSATTNSVYNMKYTYSKFVSLWYQTCTCILTSVPSQQHRNQHRNMQLKDSIQANPTFVIFQYPPSLILKRQPHKFLSGDQFDVWNFVFSNLS